MFSASGVFIEFKIARFLIFEVSGLFSEDAEILFCPFRITRRYDLIPISTRVSYVLNSSGFLVLAFYKKIVSNLGCSIAQKTV